MEERVAWAVRSVCAQALADRGLPRIALLDDGGPEAALAMRMLAQVGAEPPVRVTAARGEVESILHLLGASERQIGGEDVRRLKAAGLTDALAANPINRTALLLCGGVPPEPLLPLGDLYASEVAAMTGRWSAPPEVREIARAAGGVEELDDALRRWIDRRDPRGLDGLPPHAAEAVRRAFHAGRPARTWPHVVPKLGYRTLGVDLHE
jgi:hypothetical protein